MDKGVDKCAEKPWLSQVSQWQSIRLCQCRRHGFDPWSRKTPWKRKGQPTSVLLPGKCNGRRSLEGYSPQGHNLAAEQQQHLDYQFSQFSHSVVSSSLWPHGLQQARLPCPSPTPGVHSNSCPLSWWCHLTISSSVVPFSSCPQSLPASVSFPMNQFIASGGQSIRVSASASVPSMNIQSWFPLGWTGWIFLQSKGLSRVFSNTTVQKHQFFSAQLSSQSSSHIHTWPLEKP